MLADLRRRHRRAEAGEERLDRDALAPGVRRGAGDPSSVSPISWRGRMAWNLMPRPSSSDTPFA